MVLLDAGTRVLAVNAIGDYGRAQVRFMLDSGTRIVAHVAPGRADPEIDGLPRFATIAEAVAATGADAAAVYTPPSGLRDSVVEAAEAGLRLVFAAAEFVPVHDVAQALAFAREAGTWVVGPNSIGIATPGEALLGVLPSSLTLAGRVGVIARSGTLAMNLVQVLSTAGIGQSTIVHVGGDILCGRNPHEWLDRFLADPGTDAVLYAGEPGGSKEYAMLETIAGAAKPVVVLMIGRHAPRGKVLGHAGALIGRDRDTASAKAEALRAAGARVVSSALGVAEALRDALPARQGG
jgi:succinyl-CoA synthetase alpha subunit